MMGLFFVGYATLYFIIGIPFLIIWGIWWIIDAFLVGAYVEKNLQKVELKERLKLKDKEDDLKRLYELFESGAISKAEFEARKEILFR